MAVSMVDVGTKYPMTLLARMEIFLRAQLTAAKLAKGYSGAFVMVGDDL
jgi:hypothetical protein